MKKKTNKDQQENYLERKPKRHEAIAWAKDEKGIVTLDIENTYTGNINIISKLYT